MGTGPAPEQIRRLSRDETFRFRCHPGLACFNLCCRQLELALTPYDVLRLSRGLGIPAVTFLERYAVVEQLEQDPFPQVFLAMVDDGQARCPFVTPAGCAVYPDRPGACRTYPVGRGVLETENGREEIHVLLTEPHCRGFSEPVRQDLGQWEENQEIGLFNQLNDALLAVVHHPRLQDGHRLDEREAELFLQTLYQLDAFRDRLGEHSALEPEQRRRLASDDIALYHYAVQWLRHELFGE